MTSDAIVRHEPVSLTLPGKRVTRAVLALAIAAALGLALRSQLLTPAFLHINAMQVYGELRWVDRDKLTEAVKPYLDSNFFNADLSGIKQTVESLPWVASASVRRQWPNQLQIIVREQHPVARWKGHFLINDAGELFQPAGIPASMQQALVQLQGPENTYRQLLKIYRELQPLFLNNELTRGVNQQRSNPVGESTPDEGLTITKVYLNERRALRVELKNGMRIVFGRMNASMDLYNAAARFQQAFANGLQEKAAQIATVDLRYTNGFAVQWKHDSKKQN